MWFWIQRYSTEYLNFRTMRRKPQAKHTPAMRTNPAVTRMSRATTDWRAHSAIELSCPTQAPARQTSLTQGLRTPPKHWHDNCMLMSNCGPDLALIMSQCICRQPPNQTHGPAAPPRSQVHLRTVNVRSRSITPSLSMGMAGPRALREILHDSKSSAVVS